MALSTTYHRSLSSTIVLVVGIPQGNGYVHHQESDCNNGDFHVGSFLLLSKVTSVQPFAIFHHRAVPLLAPLLAVLVPMSSSC